MISCKEYSLANGLTVLAAVRDSQSVAIQVTVKVGSVDEDDTNRGISHFLEHMVFEGTMKRDAETIAREIEGIGGEIGAFTGNERTCFYVRCLNKHVEKSLEILSDIINNPLFDKAIIAKERGVILSEVMMRKDEPRMNQWKLLLHNLFINHPAKHPVIGYQKNIRSISRKDLIGFHAANYVPNNIILSVSGGVFSLPLIDKYFGGMKRKNLRLRAAVKEPKKTVTLSRSMKKQISQSYTVMGCKSVPRKERDSYVLDVIRAILGKGLSGRLFIEIRTKRGLSYDVGIHHEARKDFGFFACYVSCDKSKLQECRGIFHQEISRLDDVSNRELEEAKNYIEGSFIMEHEDNQSLADSLSEWKSRDLLERFNLYIRDIRSVTKQDIIRVRDDYLSDFVTATILQK